MTSGNLEHSLDTLTKLQALYLLGESIRTDIELMSDATIIDSDESLSEALRRLDKRVFVDEQYLSTKIAEARTALYDADKEVEDARTILAKLRKSRILNFIIKRYEL